MKNFIVRILLFLFFLTFFYSGCVFLWGLIFSPNMAKNLKLFGPGGHLNSRIRDSATCSDVDVLFLGSSHAYRGFDPRVFRKYGIKSFNLGSSAQTPIQTEILLKRYLNSLNPKLIVYEVYPSTLSLDGVESALDLIANDRIDFPIIKMAIDLNHPTVYNSLIYGIVRDLLDLDRDFVEPIHQGTDKYVKGGFVEKKISFYENVIAPPSKKWESLKYQREAFERIIKKLQKFKRNVILVQAPVTKERYDSYSNNSEFDLYFRLLADYYNFNHILELPSTSCFYDSHHLNQDGVEIFNKALVKILRNSNYF